MRRRLRWCGLVLLLAMIAAPRLADAETLGETFRRVNPAVVVIRAVGEEITEQGVTRFAEIGSGVLISPDGKIVTAAHVVHTMDHVVVEFLGADPVPARVIASEPRADISLIQAVEVPRDAVVMKLTDSDPVKVGDEVFIVGAPYGLKHSLSSGIVSARWEEDTVTKDFPLAEFFQTTAAINTGNSGGPMFSRSGELIGIVSHNISKSGGSEGLGFVVTSNTVRELLIERKRYWSGIDAVPVTGATAEALGVPQAGGFLVVKVIDGSIGARLGLRGGNRIGIVAGQKLVVGGDVMLSVEGIPMTDGAGLARVVEALDKVPDGQIVTVTALRDGKVITLTTKWGR